RRTGPVHAAGLRGEHGVPARPAGPSRGGRRGPEHRADRAAAAGTGRGRAGGRGGPGRRRPGPPARPAPGRRHREPLRRARRLAPRRTRLDRLAAAPRRRRRRHGAGPRRTGRPRPLPGASGRRRARARHRGALRRRARPARRPRRARPPLRPRRGRPRPVAGPRRHGLAHPGGDPHRPAAAHRRARRRRGAQPHARHGAGRAGRPGRHGAGGPDRRRGRGHEDGAPRHRPVRRNRRRTAGPPGAVRGPGRPPGRRHAGVRPGALRTHRHRGAELMPHRLSPEHEELRRTVEEFARTEVAPVIGDYYERSAFPYEIVAKMGRMGLFGLPFPEEVGGMGGDYFALCLALEELARVDSSVAITLEAGVSLGAMPIHRFGTPEQKATWLPRLCSGAALGAFGLTEPGGGSDAGATRTTARLDGGQWVVNGTKCFITNSGTAITALVTVTAVTGRRPDGRPEISAIIVPSGTPGLSVGQKYSKVGWSASDTNELVFADCRVPEDNLLGERGRGYAQFLRILDEGRIAIAALAVGLAQGCVDESLRYAGERQAFGHAIGRYQAIQFKIADMAARVHTARLAYYDAAARDRKSVV